LFLTVLEGQLPPNFAFSVRAAFNPENPPIAQPKDLLVDSIGKPQREGFGDKVRSAFHIHIQTLEPANFLQGAKEFLVKIGLIGPTKISFDQTPIYPEKTNKTDLAQAIDSGLKRLKPDENSVQTIEISSEGKTDDFELHLDFFYSRRHLVGDCPIELEVKALANEYAPREGESIENYRIRMNALDSDVKKSEEIRLLIKDKKKELYSRFVTMLSSAFPGIKAEIFERVSPV
jgi:hypothetical protein